MPSPTAEISPPPFKRRRVFASPLSQSPVKVRQSSPIPIAAHETSSQTVKSLRIYSWNVNGILPFLPPTDGRITTFLTPSSKPKAIDTQPSLRVNLHRWKWPDILFLQEVKIAPLDTKTPALLGHFVNSPLDAENVIPPKDQLYDAHFSLPRDRFNATGLGGKVYGVCALIRQDLSPGVTVHNMEWDLEGRVQVIEIPSLGLIVINVYAVNGTTNDYRDPKTGKIIGDRHDRKRTFHSLLANEVKTYEERGWGVVVAGDININRSSIDSFPQLRFGEDHVQNRADFEKKFITELNMLDTYRFKHGNERKYSYRPTNKPWGAGGDRVDMILVTKGLREYVKEADLLDSEVERGPSDHVPLLVELEVQVRPCRGEMKPEV